MLRDQESGLDTPLCILPVLLSDSSNRQHLSTWAPGAYVWSVCPSVRLPRLCWRFHPIPYMARSLFRFHLLKTHPSSSALALAGAGAGAGAVVVSLLQANHCRPLPTNSEAWVIVSASSERRWAPVRTYRPACPNTGPNTGPNTERDYLRTFRYSMFPIPRDQRQAASSIQSTVSARAFPARLHLTTAYYGQPTATYHNPLHRR